MAQRASQPRSPVVTPFEPYLRERIAAFPELTGSRLLREIKELGYAGGYTAVKDFLRTVRPKAVQAFDHRLRAPFSTDELATLRSLLRRLADSAFEPTHVRARRTPKGAKDDDNCR